MNLDEITELRSQIKKLTAERDAALDALELSDAIVAADTALINELKSALREAKEALQSCKRYEPSGEHYYDAAKAEKAIATINEVLGEE